jgi:hypothetical protein
MINHDFIELSSYHAAIGVIVFITLVIAICAAVEVLS